MATFRIWKRGQKCTRKEGKLLQKGGEQPAPLALSIISHYLLPSAFRNALGIQILGFKEWSWSTLSQLKCSSDWESGFNWISFGQFGPVAG